MLFIDNRNITDPRINLAIEEYALRYLGSGESFLLFYVNEPSVIIGKHQNTAEEINSDFIEERSIHVVRRLSGGGAVATALLVGFIFAIPFLFIKKKKHWLAVQAGEKFAVIKLGDQNFRQIVAELESKGVKVNDLKDESKSSDDEKAK